MQTKYNINSVIAATIGRKLYSYDSFNGSSMCITVESAEQLSNSVLFTGINAWGNKSGIYVDNDCIAQLILNGESEKHDTIEYCHVSKKFNLN